MFIINDQKDIIQLKPNFDKIEWIVADSGYGVRIVYGSPRLYNVTVIHVETRESAINIINMIYTYYTQGEHILDISEVI